MKIKRENTTAVWQIRPAQAEDASRIAEIWIFAKRTAYRSIFQNDQVSFGEMQVLPLALSLRDEKQLRQDLWVYEEGFVKGTVWCSGEDGSFWISDLYVDPFFQGAGVGKALLEHCVAMAQGDQKQLRLWVLEKNGRARQFYERSGFVRTGNRKEEPGTEEYLIEYVKEAKNGKKA